MVMTDDQIIREYKQAKSPLKQIGILADLNGCTKREIAEILLVYGEPVPKYYMPKPETTTSTEQESTMHQTELRIEELFRDGLDDVSIAERLDISMARVKSIRCRMGLKRLPGRSPKPFPGTFLDEIPTAVDENADDTVKAASEAAQAAAGIAQATAEVAQNFESLAETTKDFGATMEPSTRAGILWAAERCVCGEREQDYGSPEDSFQTIADLWAAYLQGCGVSLDFLEPYDVAAMMALLKIARIATGHGKADNWIDLAGYAACGGELERDKYKANIHGGG